MKSKYADEKRNATNSLLLAFNLSFLYSFYVASEYAKKDDATLAGSIGTGIGSYTLSFFLFSAVSFLVQEFLDEYHGVDMEPVRFTAHPKTHKRKREHTEEENRRRARDDETDAPGYTMR